MSKKQKRSSRLVMQNRLKKGGGSEKRATGNGVILSPFAMVRPKTTTARTASRGE